MVLMGLSDYTLIFPKIKKKKLSICTQEAARANGRVISLSFCCSFLSFCFIALFRRTKTVAQVGEDIQAQGS